MAQTKIVDTGEIVCGFAVRKDYEGQKDFDKTYKEITIKQRVKKIGDGENDFLVEEYEEVKETPIAEVLAAQVDQVGIEAYLRPYQIAGVEPPSVHVGDEIFDTTQFPEDPADVSRVGDEMMRVFNSMDPELRGDAKNVEDFLSSITDERLKAYYASKLKLNVEKGKEENEK